MKTARVLASKCRHSLCVRDHIWDEDDKIDDLKTRITRTEQSLAAQRRSLTALEQKRQRLQGEKP
jgi:hypothetical protein